MAFDGLVISNIKSDLEKTIVGGRINKIYQPEPDEINLTIKNQKNTYRLMLSASASLPLVYFIKENKVNPMVAPNFCMLLRKYINNAKIIKVEQPEFERILVLYIEHMNEMGDLCVKKLIIEIMGKHSNIIFTDEEDRIIDSIKHISAQISSVREVLPGRNYILPPSHDKISPLHADFDSIEQLVCKKPSKLDKAIYTSFRGISPLIAQVLCYHAGIASDKNAADLSTEEKESLLHALQGLKTIVENAHYTPNIVYEGKEPKEFSSVALPIYSNLSCKSFDSISDVLDAYYTTKNVITRIRQKSSDLRRIITTAIERTSKKLDLQLRQLKDTEKREKYRIYGELLHTYGYDAKPGDKSLTCLNYYTNEDITIPLDDMLSASENAKKYFAKYNKLKRTYEALSVLTLETKQELEHLESILTSLDIALAEADLSQIKEELMDYGYIKRRYSGKKEKKAKTVPLHFLSSDGFHMYVGKNNYQNEELTFKFANGKDMWFHAKKMAGSHVIVKVPVAADEIPDRTYEEAGRLAAYYSKGRTAPKVEIDYTERKNLKKPPKAAPGFVIYHTNYSLTIEPDISGIELIEG